MTKILKFWPTFEIHCESSRRHSLVGMVLFSSYGIWALKNHGPANLFSSSQRFLSPFIKIYTIFEGTFSKKKSCTNLM